MRKIFAIFLAGFLLVLYALNIGASGDTAMFTLEGTDPEGDVVAVNPQGTMVDDTDIVSLSTQAVGTDIEIDLTVKGTIHLTSDGTYFAGYSFSMDTNDDGVEDWSLSITVTAYTTDPIISLSNDDIEYTTGITATGDGTSTLTVIFPQSYISDPPITAWGINGGVSIFTSDYSSTTTDSIPDDEGYLTATGTDTGGDDTGGSSTTDDTNSTSGVQDTSIIITILKPQENERIEVNSQFDTYMAEGTVDVPEGKTVDFVEYRIKELDDNWQDATDNSTTGDWSSWTILLPVGGVVMMGITTDLTVHLEVRAVLMNGDYNMDSRTFVIVPPGSSGSSGSGGTGGTGGGTGTGTDEGSGSDSGSSSGGSFSSDLITEGPDPGTETPTDRTISVKITSFDFSYKDNGDDTYSMSINVKGTTSGVDHCKITFIFYYTDGTHDEKAYWYGEGDLDSNPYLSMAGYKEFHFKPTSSQWKTWEFSLSGTFKEQDTTDSGTSGGEDNEGNEGKTAKFVRVYVRAYADASETKWNQAYKDYNYESGGSSSGSKDKSSGIPGFDALVMITAITSVVAIAAAIQRRKE